MQLHRQPGRKPQRAIIYLTLIVGSLVFTACPPKVPNQSQLIDTRLAEVPTSETVYQADALANDYHAGQWLQYKSIDENAEPTIVTYKLIASDGFNHSIEVVEEDYHGGYATYMEIQFDPGRSAESLQVRRVLTRHGESSPKESSPEDLSVKESYYRALASQLFIPWAESPMQEDVSVAGGQFKGSLRIEAQLTVGGLAFRANSWHHPAVPMHAMVKAERVDGTEGTIELISFGLDGAHSDVLRAVR